MFSNKNRTNKDRMDLLDTKPRICFFIQMAFGTAFAYLTSGVYLSGLAMLMNAGDVVISYLSIIVNICGVLILLFAPFLERFKSRKRLTIGLTVLSRLFTFFIVMIPAFVPAKIQLAIFLPTVVLAFTLQAQTTVVLNQWMMGFIEEKRSGRYISLRQTLALVVTVILSVTGGYWMDFMQGKYTGFVILFAVAGIMGGCEIVLLVRTPDSELYQPSNRCGSLKDMIRFPLKNKSFAGFVFYVFAFYLILYIGDSYTMVYMMKYLALPYSTVTILYMIIALPQIFILGIWGKLSDKYGHEFVLKISIWLFVGETIFMFFASSQTWFIFIPVAFFVSSVANAGFVISVFNRRYELMPEDNRIVYDNFYTAAIGLGFIFGPMIGGSIKGLLETGNLIPDVMEYMSIRCLYLISAIGIVILQIIYLYKQKKRKEEANVNY